MKIRSALFITSLVDAWETLLRIYPLLFDRFRHDLLVDLAFLGEGVEGADDDGLRVDFEEAAQVLARVAATEAVRSQGHQSAGDPRGDLVGDGAHVIGHGDKGPF